MKKLFSDFSLKTTRNSLLSSRNHKQIGVTTARVKFIKLRRRQKINTATQQTTGRALKKNYNKGVSRIAPLSPALLHVTEMVILMKQ